MRALGALSPIPSAGSGLQEECQETPPIQLTQQDRPGHKAREGCGVVMGGADCGPGSASTPICPLGSVSSPATSTQAHLTRAPRAPE